MAIETMVQVPTAVEIPAPSKSERDTTKWLHRTKLCVQVPTASEIPAPSTSDRDTTKWLHKTKLCVYNIQGSCRLGSKCSFAHSPTEIQDTPNLHKTQLCAAYAAGNCSDENCTFAHGEEELRMSPNFKNKPCKWFGKGQCRNGAECSFAHGTEELRGNRPQVKQNDQAAAIPPPPGLSLVTAEAPKVVLDLESGLLDAKVPPSSVELQLEGMTAQIAALQNQMNEIVVRTQVGNVKQFLGQLTAQCAELEQYLDQAGPTAEADIWKKQRTPLKTALSSKAAPFQPSTWSAQAKPFVPACMAAESYWQSDDSTSIGSGGFSSD